MARKNFINPWKDILEQWSRITAPGRPSKQEVKIFERFLSPKLKSKKVRILLLGSTPELRDMLAERHNIEATIADINLYMIIAMAECMKIKKSNENYLVANWLNAPLRNNYFDAVVGDFVIPNLSKKDLPLFLNNVKKWLKPGGHFITRVNTYSSLNQFKKFDDILNYYSKPPITKGKINFFWQVGIFNSHSIRKNREFIARDFYAKLRKYYKQGKYVHPVKQVSRFLKAAHELFPESKVWTGYWRKEMDAMLKKYFIIKNFGQHKKDWVDEDIIYQLINK